MNSFMMHVAFFAVTIAMTSCGSAAPGPSGVTGGGGFTPGTGSNTTARVVKTRVVNAYAPAGVKQARDLYVRQPSSGEFQRVAANLAYGDEAIFDAPVNALDSAVVYPVDVGSVPVLGMAASMESDDIAETDPSPITFVLRESRSAGIAFLYQKFTDRADRNRPAAGKAGIVFLSSTAEGIGLPTGYNMKVVGETCLPFADVFNDVRVDLDPGTKVLAWLDDSSSMSCTGPVFAQSASITFAAGEAFFLIPIGEALAELTIKAFKMQ